MPRLVLAVLLLLTGLRPLAAAEAERGPARSIPRVPAAPTVDGKLDEWQKLASFRLVCDNQRLLNSDDLSATVWLAWDAEHLFLAANVKDDKLLNQNAPEQIGNGDVLVWFLGVRPDQQGDVTGPNDYRLYLAPSSADAKPVCRWLTAAGKVAKEIAAADDASGLRWALVPGAKGGYQLEAAIPFKALARGPALAGDQLSSVIAIFDRDDPTRNEWEQWHTRVESSSQKAAPKRWPLLVLAETVPVAAEPAGAAAPAPAKPAPAKRVSVSLPRQKPANVFAVGTAVSSAAQLKSDLTGPGTALVKVTDYFGKTVRETTLPFAATAGKPVPLPLELGALGAGYYTLAVEAKVTDAAGGQASGTGQATLGIAPLVQRTAKEVREGGYRFGLKMSYLGQAWWRGNAEWDEREVVDATCKLGLQWTRALLQEQAHLSTLDLLKDFPMNVMFKVERFPPELYDAAKYGPMADWEKANGRGVWVLKTLPQKEPYQAWLRAEVKKLPADQNIFEVWNEAWDKMTAEDLATISGWIVDAILAERPQAIIGPNLMGRTSKYEYDAAFVRAGGLRGMKMVALHPYGGAEDRASLREYRRWLKEQTGREFDLYVTEYGSHSAPAGPSKRSEEEQARRTVRQSLCLYAEGIKAMAAHWLGQREENPTYHEDWFGFYRLNHEPKPVLLATATCARMIDGKRYVGDLWYGPGIGAMLFERDEKYTLVLYTREGELPAVVQPGVPQVTLVDMVGGERTVAVADGKLPLTVGVDVTYVVGVAPALAKEASTELRADRWPQPEQAPRNRRVAHRFAAPPALDGKLDEWAQMTQLAMVDQKVNGNDASGIAYLGWDAQHLYVALAMRDDHVMNTQPRGKLYREDSLELFVSTDPREDNAGYGPRDHQFFITPASAEGGPVVGLVEDPNAGKVTDVAGARQFIGLTPNGWVAEVALPWTFFAGFAARPGARLALELRVNDADKSHARWKIDPADGNVQFANPTVWSLLDLVE